VRARREECGGRVGVRERGREKTGRVMRGAFACPECGCEIRLGGVAPGRQVRCDWCDSLVEVPFLPRAEQVTRSRHARYKTKSRWWTWRKWPIWARLGTPVLVVAILVAAGARVASSRWHSADEDALAKMLDTSVEAEKAGRLGDALVEVQSALARASRMKPPPTCLDALKQRRDVLSVREVEAQLARLDGASGDLATAVGRALTLQARAVRDPALGGLATSIEATLERLRQAWAEADAVEAAKAFDEGRLDRAMELCERQHRTADELPAASRRRSQAEAAALARRVIERHGIIVEPVKGAFTLGSPDSYATLLRPVLLDGLRLRGYLPRPARPVWPEIWTDAAPFRITFDVVEHQDETYLQSPNRVSRIDGKLALARGGSAFWHDAPGAHTQVPLPGLPAYQASRMAVSAHRSPDFERLLYDNARAGLAERIGIALRNVPECVHAVPTPAPGATAGASGT
jgi:hypothetical protein